MKIKNPLLSVDMPDPDLLRVGDVWYMVSTTMFYMPGGPVLRSRDLCSWEIVSYIFEELEDNGGYRLEDGQNAYGCGQWATSLAYQDGYYHACFVCNDLNRTYFCRTRDIEQSNWERTWVEGIYHDMSFLFWEGRSYLIYGNGDLRIVELQEDLMGVRPETDRLFLETPSDGLRLRCEGCRAYVRNGYLYLLLIDWPVDGNDGGRRREICYRSKSLNGPFERRVLLNDDGGREGCGVAQGALTDSPSGQWYAVMFQDRGAVGRIPYLLPVRWEEDWPVLGDNGTVPLEWECTEEEMDAFPAEPLVISDSFRHRENRLRLPWQWNHNPHPDDWSFTERPGYLRLKNRRTAKELLNAQNTLTQRTEEPYSCFTVELDGAGMLDGDYAGICALQGYYGQIGLAKENGAWYLQTVARREDGTRELARTELPRETGARIFLKAEFSFSDKKDQAAFYYSLDNVHWMMPAKPVQLKFTLDIFVGCRVGLFCYGTAKTGGFADFREFRFEGQKCDPENR